MNSRRSSNVGCFILLDKYSILFTVVLVFGAECPEQAKDKQAYDYQPACGHK